MAAYPDGGGAGPNDIPAANPYPAAIPSPITRGPDIIGARGDGNDLDLRGRRGRRCHNDGLRGRDDRLRRRLRRHRNRGCRRSRPVGCRGGRRGRRRGSGGGLGRNRLDLVSDRRRVRLLDHVDRLSVVYGHVSHLPLRTASDQSCDTRERRARGPYFSLHKIKVIHIQSVGRYIRAAS